MKIRLDFVTNSSSSSFIAFGVFDEELISMFKKLKEEKGEIRATDDFLCGIAVFSDCVTVSASLCDFDPYTNYAINRMDPEENYDGDALIRDGKKAKTLDNFQKAFSIFTEANEELDEDAVMSAVERAFQNGKVITEVYYDETDCFYPKSFSLSDFIPENIKIDTYGTFIKYTERESDNGVLVFPSKVNYVSKKLLSGLPMTKKIVLNYCCRLEANMFAKMSSLEEIDMSHCYDVNYHRPLSSSKDVFSSRKDNTFMKEVFNGCKLLKKITIPMSFITEDMLQEMKSLEEVVVTTRPQDIIECIPNNFCRKCTKLKSVNISGNIYKINDGAFEGCSSLENIEFPKNVSFISESAFRGCENLSYDSKEKISTIKEHSAEFEQFINDSIEYIKAHGCTTYSFSSYRDLLHDRTMYEKWHALYDVYFDTIASLGIGKFKYTVWGDKTEIEQIQNKYAKQFLSLRWKYTKTFTEHTNFLFVDTKNIPAFDRFKIKQGAISSGADEANLTKNILDKAIFFKQTKAYPIIISLEDFCDFLEKGNFVEDENQPQRESNKKLTSAENGMSSVKTKYQASITAKKEKLEIDCEAVIDKITEKSKQQSSHFTMSELKKMIIESDVLIFEFKKYLKRKYNKTIEDFFSDLGILSTGNE